jgi:hypothetical protein
MECIEKKVLGKVPPWKKIIKNILVLHRELE